MKTLNLESTDKKGTLTLSRICKIKNLKLALFAMLIAAGFSSCVVSAHPYGAHWVPGHYEPGYYRSHWVPGHWA
jgi:hypothetical protein